MTEPPSSAARQPARKGPQLELTIPPLGFRALVWSDYEMTLLEREEAYWTSKLLYMPRLLVNPSLQLALLVRVAQRGPQPLLPLIRMVQLLAFSSEIHKFAGDDAIEIGPAIAFPHPANVFMGPVTIGAGVTIYNNTTIGANRHIPRGGRVEKRPRIGDRAVVYGYSAVQGNYDVGHDAVVGTHVIVDRDVPPGSLLTYRRLRLASEWPGEGRMRWRLPGRS